MVNRKARIAVLVSGGGTNLQAILDAQEKGIITSGEVVLVVSNTRKAYALERAARAGVEALVVNKKQCGGTVEAWEEKLIQVLEEREIDLIVLAGFMAILSESFTGRFPKRIINIHPSLIPSFCGEGYYGLRVHEEALAKGVKVTGATVHYVNEIPDGGEIIMQKAVEVQEGDTPEILQLRVMKQAEWIIFPAAVEKVAGLLMEKECNQ
ncbi:MAG: phosphoribosylglycinamide formyltransferase [Lachnospiraceae bacterium]|nr:phosphoribosylglycinamide formyltransferase [Lachnospiraceae bacterium]